MTKSESNNSFGEGLMMDMNPLTTPNTIMTSCLNGTLITFNGNEYILQNDMGNGRVETAYLPEGFVPLGTTELGGIIYIVSYNPDTNRCQIGSFPSPERNITSDEVSEFSKVSISNSDFGWNNENEGAKIYYIKKSLDSKMTFNPGDKFIVYGNNINNNINDIQGIELTEASKIEIIDKVDKARNESVRFSIGTITSDGKLIIFDNLKQFKINDNGDTYYIFNYIKEDGTDNKLDLDDYRSLVSQPYNIFDSKRSGELVIIAELVACDSFDASISHSFIQKKDIKEYRPSVTFTFKGEHDFVPYGVQCKFSLKNHQNPKFPSNVSFKKDIVINNITKVSKEYQISIKDLVEDTDFNLILSNYNFNDKNRPETIFTYEFIPCMKWGPINYLTVKGEIDLSKLGTGVIELDTWRYYNSENKCTLNWGLKTYEEEGCKVSKVTFTFYSKNFTEGAIDNKSVINTEDIIDNEGIIDNKSVIYHIDQKPSYHGDFYEVIPFNQSYYKFGNSSNEYQLYPNNLYFVLIKVYYDRPNRQDNEIKCFGRWLYTNDYFNNKYYDTEDYNNLTLEFNTKVNFQYSTEIYTANTQEKYGTVKTSEEENADFDSKSSMSAIQMVRTANNDCKVKFTLAQDYNSFALRNKEEANNAKVTIGKPTLIVSSDLKYIEREDSYYKDYLKNNDIDFEQSTDEDNKIPDLSQASPDDLIDGNKKYGNGIRISTPLDSEQEISPELKDGTYSFHLGCQILELTKAYCSKKEELLHYSGSLKPLCYNASTFAEYNLIQNPNDKTKWIPEILGTFAFCERGGSKGKAFIGSIRQDTKKFNHTRYKEKESINVEFGLDSNIIEHEKNNGWRNSTMFVTHYGSDVNEPKQVFNSSTYKNSLWLGLDDGTKKDSTFSVDAFWHNSTEEGKNLVILMMKANDNEDRYYPINFCIRQPIMNDVSTYFTGNYFQQLYQTFAQILNNIYRYDTEGIESKFIVPDQVYYGDNYIYNVSIPLKITMKVTENNCFIAFKISDNNFIPLEDFNTLIPKQKTNEQYPEQDEHGFWVNMNNLTYNINGASENNIISIKDVNNSGRTLRDYILNQKDFTLGIAVYDFDGKTIINTQNGSFKSTELYYRIASKDTNGTGQKVGNIETTVSRASNFDPVTIEYDVEGNALPNGESGKHFLYSDTGDYTPNTAQNLNKDYILSDDGKLVIKNPDKIGVSFERYGGDDKGLVTGYQTIGFYNAYKAWY